MFFTEIFMIFPKIIQHQPSHPSAVGSPAIIIDAGQQLLRWFYGMKKTHGLRSNVSGLPWVTQPGYD